MYLMRKAYLFFIKTSIVPSLILIKTKTNFSPLAKILFLTYLYHSLTVENYGWVSFDNKFVYESKQVQNYF